MDSVEDLDLEDLESRLYSQVFHASAEFSETIQSTNTDLNILNEPLADYYKKKYRYFDQKLDLSVTRSPNQVLKSVPITENFCNTQVNPSVFNTLSVQQPYSENNSYPANTNITPENLEVIKNISENQCSFPLLVDSNTLLPSVLPNYLSTLFTSPIQKTLRNKKNKKVRKKKNLVPTTPTHCINSLKNLIGFAQELTGPNSDTICLTDSESDECVILEEMSNYYKQDNLNTKFPKKYSDTEGGKPPEPDDDIIFVPPPPVEVIEVDVDEHENSEKTSKHLLGPAKDYNKDLHIETSESNLSNDFLDNSNLESNISNFNFSLHGSDFNSSQTEIIEPQKSTEYCETESSCSTNETHNRNFSNTVKTIVFDEVEFPKEDIFSEKNLESFSSFITPKRVSSSKIKNSTIQPERSSSANNDVNILSDNSSSESDYESNSNKNLPNLSAVDSENVPNKRLKKTGSEFFKPSIKRATKAERDCLYSSGKSKKKKDVKDQEKSSRRKRQSTNDNLVKTDLSITDLSLEKLDEECHSSTPNSSKKKKKKKVNSLSISQEDTTAESSAIMVDEKTTVDDIADISRTKKKKKKKDSMSDRDPTDTQAYSEKDCINIDDEDNNGNYNSEQMKKNKKKRGSSENNIEMTTDVKNQNNNGNINNLLKDIEITKNLVQNFLQENGRQKKKKTGWSELSEMQDETVGEDTEAGESSVKTDKSRKKKKKPKEREKKPLSSQSVSRTPDNLNKTQELIVLDSTDSSDNEALILSSDSDISFETLDDIGTDLAINCSANQETLIDTDINNEDVNKIIDHVRVPLKDFEKFDTRAIQSKQSDDPSKWQISYRDSNYYYDPRVNRGPRCSRCRHFGHTGIRCPEKPHPPPCSLCGSSSHQEPRCPNKRCTQCGNPGDYSTTYCSQCFKFRHTVCNICQMPGHIQKFCPDLWRRYHETKDGPIMFSLSPPTPRNQQWCSGCAKQGHLEHECDYYNRQFPPTTPYIMNYTDILCQNKIKLPVTMEMTLEKAITPPTIPSLLDLPVANPFIISNEPTIFPSPTMVNQQMAPPQMVNNILNFVPSSGIPIHNLSNERLVVPHISNSNLTIQVPNDIVLQMSLNFNNHVNDSNTHDNQDKFKTDDLKQDEKVDIHLRGVKHVENFIMRRSFHDVCQFIQPHIDKMENSNLEPRMLKRKLSKFDKIINRAQRLSKRLLHEKNHWYSTINMFIFGVNKMKDGKLHVNNLKRILAQEKKLDIHKRRSLFSSYWYIFGSTRRPYIDYYKVLRLLCRRYPCPKS